MKKISEWLNELPEPYRTQALEYFYMHNTTLFTSIKTESNIKDALKEGFVWGATKQGRKYWSKLYDTL